MGGKQLAGKLGVMLGGKLGCLRECAGRPASGPFAGERWLRGDGRRSPAVVCLVGTVGLGLEWCGVWRGDGVPER